MLYEKTVHGTFGLWLSFDDLPYVSRINNKYADLMTTLDAMSVYGHSQFSDGECLHWEFDEDVPFSLIERICLRMGCKFSR